MKFAVVLQIATIAFDPVTCASRATWPAADRLDTARLALRSPKFKIGAQDSVVILRHTLMHLLVDSVNGANCTDRALTQT